MAEVLLGTAMQSVVLMTVRLLVQQGARRLELERARSRYLYGDATPEEEPLNLCLVGEVFLQLLVAGFGFLASIWATVVLLGGFATILQKMDFWFATVIVFIESARILGFNPYPEAKFFSEVPQAFIDLGQKPLTQKVPTRPASCARLLVALCQLPFRFLVKTSDFMGELALVVLLISIAPVAAALTCIVLSIVRLMAIAGEDYGGASTDATKANVKPALIFFYALVLTQGAFFLMYLRLWDHRQQVARSVRNKCGFDTKETTKLIDKYIDNTVDTCIQAGVSNTIKRNLVSFAQDLLRNESDDGHITAVSVLHRLMEQEAHRARAISQIHTSEQSIGRLIGMLSSKSLVDDKTKKYTAAVVAKLARDMHLADIPRAIRSISSLLDPPSVNRVKLATEFNHCQHQQIQNQNAGTTNTTESKALIAHGLLSKLCGDPHNCSENQQLQNQNPGTTNTTESKALIAHGLLILSELCGDPNNCMEILETKGLVSKIIAPLHNGFYPGKTDDDASIEIIRESLGVVTKLVRGTGGNGTVLTGQFLGDANSINEMVRNITGDEQRSETLLIDIVKKLALDEARRGNFQHMSDFVDELLHLCFGDNSNKVQIINELLHLFFDDNNSEDATTAGQALTTLARSSEDNCRMIMGARTAVIGKLADMLGTVTHVKHRTVIAQMLSHFCAMSIAQERCLEPLRSKFIVVLRVISGVEPQTAEVQLDVDKNQALSQQNPQDNEACCVRFVLFLKALPNEAERILRKLRSFIEPKHELRQNQMEPNESKLLAALLSLAVQMITKNLLPAANLLSIALDGFVKKLKEVVERNSESTPDCLEIIRATAKLSSWIMEGNHIPKQSFQQEKFDEVLKNAAEIMLELERCMLLTSSVADTASYETLSSLVKTTNDLIKDNE